MKAIGVLAGVMLVSGDFVLGDAQFPCTKDEPVVAEGAFSGYNAWPMVQTIGSKVVCAYSRGTAYDIGQEWRDRRVQQRTDGETAEFIKFLKAQKFVKAVLCGHCHEHWEEPLSVTVTQYVAAATYKGEATYLEIL